MTKAGDATLHREEVPEAAGCYELGVSYPLARHPRWILYVGMAGDSAGNLRTRLSNYANHGDRAMWRKLRPFVEKGYWIHYRYRVTKTRREAAALESALIRRGWHHYRWNRAGIPPDIG